MGAYCEETITAAQGCCLADIDEDNMAELLNLRLRWARMDQEQKSEWLLHQFHTFYDIKEGCVDHFILAGWKCCTRCTLLVVDITSSLFRRTWKAYLGDRKIKRRTHKTKVLSQDSLKSDKINKFLKELQVLTF
jgi:hypothetical protein